MATATNNTDPLFGRKNWSYVSVVRGPVRGPQPRLAQGTGRTGRPAAPGTGAQLPGYVSDNDYNPSGFSYAPKDRQNFLFAPPRTIGIGSNGRELAGTYEPRDFTPGTRFFSHMRRAENWQVQEYPVNYRNIAQYQQVMIYRPKTNTVSAQPLASSSYFLGYQIQPEIGAKIGQNALGYMGSY